jgi:hypothetical protein
METEEEREVDVMEFSLYEDEISELIEKLQELKKTKGSIDFDIDDDNSLTIHYSE